MSHNSILLDLHYLPSIQFVTKLLHYPLVKIEQHENYQKGSYRNRCHIANSLGVLVLSIPLKSGKNEQQNIREVRIAYDQPWQSQHWTAIQSAYGNSPYFEFYADGLSSFFKKKQEFLFEWNRGLLSHVLELLGISPKMEWTQKYEKNPPENILDFRNAISPNPRKAQQDDAFQQYKYVQVFEEKNGFLSNLSILDLLFCTGPEAILVLQNCCREI